MLETVREFVAERLAARPDIIEIGRRHAGYYRGLAEQADRPLRGAGRDFDGALREVTASLEELRGQDEPFFTAMAAFTAGSVNTALGRYDDAHRVLSPRRTRQNLQPLPPGCRRPGHPARPRHRHR